MKERITQSLLALLCLLIGLHLLRDQKSTTVQADSNGTPSVVRAQGFELVDPRGQVVAQLYLGTDGGGNIRLRSGDGMVRVKLGASADGSGLLLLDKEAEPAVHAVAGKDGTSLVIAQQGKDKKVLSP
jgi:hypothetical protein